jgi:branched-chain amino acid transport system permease protein
MLNSAYFLNLAVNGLVEGIIIALAALALTLIFGIARFPNAAAGDTMTLGAYAGFGAQSLLGGSIVLATVFAMAVTAAVSVFFYFTVFRKLAQRSSVAALIASIGIAFMLRSGITFFLGHDQRAFDIPIVRAVLFGPVRIVPSDLALAAAALGALAVVFLVLYATPLGRRMRAVSDDEALARASGIDAHQVMMALWILAGSVAGLSGTLLGVKTIVTPEMGWDLLLPAFAATILGGIGNPVGAVLGGLLLGVAQEISTPFVGFTYKIGLGFVVMLLVLLVRPHGLLGRAEAVR